MARLVGTDLLGGRTPPLASLPTTGTDSIPIAIVEDEDAELEKGAVSRHLIPDFAYLDAQLTCIMPRKVTASTGPLAAVLGVTPAATPAPTRQPGRPKPNGFPPPSASTGG